jgi:hypothetical protein
MSSTDDAINAARASIARSRAPAPKSSDPILAGAAIGAVVSLPLAGIGLVGGALIGAGVAALTKD